MDRVYYKADTSTASPFLRENTSYSTEGHLVEPQDCFTLIRVPVDNLPFSLPELDETPYYVLDYYTEESSALTSLPSTIYVLDAALAMLSFLYQSDAKYLTKPYYLAGFNEIRLELSICGSKTHNLMYWDEDKPRPVPYRLDPEAPSSEFIAHAIATMHKYLHDTIVENMTGRDHNLASDVFYTVVGIEGGILTIGDTTHAQISRRRS